MGRPLSPFARARTRHIDRDSPSPTFLPRAIVSIRSSPTAVFISLFVKSKGAAFLAPVYLLCRSPFLARQQEKQQMESSDLNVALVGDSVLDDHYWLDRPADDVRAQTERTLKLAYPDRSILVHNFAVDESTISCVVRGRAPAAHYRNGRKKASMEPYPVGEDGVVRPLELLRKARPTHVVLSIGGNDARIRFLQSRNPDVITALMITDGFVANLRRVIETIREEITPNIIIVYVFMPEFKVVPLLSMLPPARILQHLLVNFSKIFIELAVEYCLPIIDLSRTFDPNNKSHYGSTPIEPSNVSGQFIADLIAQVLAQFRFGEETTGRIFSGVGNDLKVQDLGADASPSFSYERELQAFFDRKSADKPSTCVVG